MALTKLPKNAIADGVISSEKIADGTIQNVDISGNISNDKLNNSSFTINGTSVSLGASQSVITYLDWQAVQVADGSTQVNAESGKGYFLDTNAGVIEVFLPSSPSRGDVVGLVDYAGTFGTNQLIINTGGVNIDSTVGSEFKVTTNNAIVECVYVDAAKGWLVYLNQAAGTTPNSALTGGNVYDSDPVYIGATGGTITTSGDYKIHTFTGDGCFVVSNIGCALVPATYRDKVDYLVVAGGGSGGSSTAVNRNSGGGGAGGYRTTFPSPNCNAGDFTISATTYPITVGGGGTGASGATNSHTSGSPSAFSTITSTGGGKGGDQSTAGSTGGSGGGGGDDSSGGSGNTPPTSPSQGSNGGDGRPGTNYSGGGGGGGSAGAGAIGGPSEFGGYGGLASISLITNSPVSYSGGGGGSRYRLGGTGPAGPATPATARGGAGQGSNESSNGGNAIANRGSGGGGSNNATGGNGGSGIVIIRYKFQ